MVNLCTPSRRESKRVETALRLQRCAVDLTVEHGFDGWTLDDLAAAADVSRRTVFNYFDGKAEVVLGPEPEIDQDRLDAFIAGGPTGDLFDDLVLLAHEATKEKTHADHDIVAVREAIMNDPRLLHLVHERFEFAATMLGDCIRQRESEDYSDDKARLLLRILMTFFDHALERTARDQTRTFSEHFDTAIADTRAVLA